MPTTTAALPTLPYEKRKQMIRYRNDDGSIGENAYPINYDEVYNLKGRLLTLVDATFTDPEQRKAHKDLIWHTLRGWMENIQQAAGDPGIFKPPEEGTPRSGDQSE